MFYVFSEGKTSKLCEILQVTRFKFGKRFFLILQDMLKLVIVINFRNKENPKILYYIIFFMESISYLVSKDD